MGGQKLLFAVLVMMAAGAVACSSGRKQAAVTTVTGVPAIATVPQSQWQLTDPSFQPLPGARPLYGSLDGSVYEIEIPLHWNHELVLYEHGFTGAEPFLVVEPPPLRTLFISQGFAWAASSFSANLYNPQAGVDATLQLLNYFKAHVGVPRRAYLYGTSMGGHVVVSSLEQHPHTYSGAFSECGVVDGVGEMDYLTSYELVAQYLAGLHLLPYSNLNTYMQKVTNALIPAMGGTHGQSVTRVGLAFESVMEYLTGGPRPFREQGFLDRLAGNFTVTFDDLKAHTPASRAGTNVGVTYQIAPGFGITDAQLNAGVFRLPADPAIRNAQTNPALAPLTGRITVPLLTIHTTGDAFVPISLEQQYRRLVDAAGRGNLLVQRAIRRPDHCQFTLAERTQAWDDLVNWVEHGVKPAGDNLLAPDLSTIGLNWTKPRLPNDPGGL